MPKKKKVQAGQEHGATITAAPRHSQGHGGRACASACGYLQDQPSATVGLTQIISLMDLIIDGGARVDPWICEKSFRLSIEEENGIPF